MVFCWSLLVILNSDKNYASLKPSPFRHSECLIFLFFLSKPVPCHTCSFFYPTGSSLFAAEAVPSRRFQPETSFGSFARDQSLPGTEALSSGGCGSFVPLRNGHRRVSLRCPFTSTLNYIAYVCGYCSPLM